MAIHDLMPLGELLSRMSNYCRDIGFHKHEEYYKKYFYRWIRDIGKDTLSILVQKSEWHHNGYYIRPGIYHYHGFENSNDPYGDRYTTIEGRQTFDEMMDMVHLFFENNGYDIIKKTRRRSGYIAS